MSDMASILGLILLAFTWLALRGMGSPEKPPRASRRRDDADESSVGHAGPTHESAH